MYYIFLIPSFYFFSFTFFLPQDILFSTCTYLCMEKVLVFFHFICYNVLTWCLFKNSKSSTFHLRIIFFGAFALKGPYMCSSTIKKWQLVVNIEDTSIYMHEYFTEE